MLTKKKTMKAIGAFVLSFIVAVTMLATFGAKTTLAAGEVYFSSTYIEIAVGETAYIGIGGSNIAACYFSYSSGGCVAGNGDGWFEDNGSSSIEIKGISEGSGYVSVSAEYTSLDIPPVESSTSQTIQVVVYTPDGGTPTPDKGGEEAETAETKEATDSEKKRTVSIDGAEYLVLNDLTGVTAPKGFKEAQADYNGEKVKVLKFNNDLTLYVLKKKDDTTPVFKVYDEKTKTFQNPKTVTQGQTTYYLLDVSKETAPKGYVVKEVEISGQKVNAFCVDPKADSNQQETTSAAGSEASTETETTTKVKAPAAGDSKQEETTAAEQPNEETTTAQESDFYYVRAIADGTVGYYSYDSKQGTLQRALAFEKLTADNSQADAEMLAALEKAQQRERILTFALIGAAVVVIALLVILLVVVGKNRRKQQDAYENYRDDDDYDKYDNYDD